MIRFIGDLHGKIFGYQDLIAECERSIQLGDFGMGFGPTLEADFIDDMIDTFPGNHKFIRGNHDDPAECKKSKHWIPDGTVIDDMMFVGGAYSIDQEHRTEGVSWWPDEELSYDELGEMIAIYEQTKPRIMVTHTFPIFIPKHYMGFSIYGNQNGSRTEQALTTMFEIWKPDIWLAGHWHQHFDRVCLGTRFICLNELEFIDLEI